MATGRRRSGRACAPRIVTVAPGWSEAYGLFLDGEVDMALAYTTSPAYHLIAEDDDSKAAAMFDEGHYMQVEVAAMTAASDQPDLARDFLALHADRRLPGGDPDHQLDVSRRIPPRPACRRATTTLAVPGEAAALLARGGARRSATRRWRNGWQRSADKRRPSAGAAGSRSRSSAALTLGTVAALLTPRRAGPRPRPGGLGGAALHAGAGAALRGAELPPRGAGRAGAGPPALSRPRGAGGAARRAVPAAGDRRGLRHRRDLGPRRARQPRARGARPARPRRLRPARRGARACLLQRGAGRAAAAAGLARHPGRAVPPRRPARLRARGRVPPHRGADAARGAAGRLRAGLPALHDLASRWR